MKKALELISTGIIGALVFYLIQINFGTKDQEKDFSRSVSNKSDDNYIRHAVATDRHVTSMKDNNEEVSIAGNTTLVDFKKAAKVASPGVVFIKTKITTQSNRLMQLWYGYEQKESLATGSGVIISDDGYLVTNQHVIDKANEIEIVLKDNRKFIAKIIGEDQSTDLALLKIESDKPFPYLTFGDSENLQIGEWVLAIGNPYRLTSTVTAGIISAKARSIDILKNKSNINYTVESFIQTDAAINPGNSGGALVNLNGELIGVNTAIASLTGSYSGYAFAIPTALVKKVTDDIMKYGEVQRAYLGVNLTEVTDQRIAHLTKETNGIYIIGAIEGGAARESGLKSGDIIVAINGRKTDNIAQMHEIIASKSPGDVVVIRYKRKNKVLNTNLTLKNKRNQYGVIDTNEKNRLGAVFKELTRAEKYYAGLRFGIKISRINKGIFQDSGIPEGFYITHIDQEPVVDIKSFNQILDKKGVNITDSGAVVILGRYNNGERDYFYLQWGKK